jgi:ABC-type transporter Mla MlaB component
VSVQLAGGDIALGAIGTVTYVDAGTGTVERFTTADGLAGDDVRSLAWDSSRGILWAGTTDGISEIHPTSGTGPGFGGDTYVYPNPIVASSTSLRLGGITGEVDGEILAVVLGGSLNGTTTEQFNQAIQDHLGHGRTKIIIDCRNVFSISSIGIASLVSLQARLRRKTCVARSPRRSTGTGWLRSPEERRRHPWSLSECPAATKRITAPLTTWTRPSRCWRQRERRWWKGRRGRYGRRGG